MTAFIRTWLVMASVALLPSWNWAQAPQFEGFAPGYGVQYNAGHQPAYTDPGPEYEQVPTNQVPWDEFDSQFDLNFDLGDLVDDSWVKVEYLNANFQRPGNVLLGAPLSSVPNPREQFFVSAGVVSNARAIVPDTSLLNLDSQNGVRTTIGINTFRDFSLEVSYVGMQDMKSAFTLVPDSILNSPPLTPLIQDNNPLTPPATLDPRIFPKAVRFYGTSVLNAGSPGSSVILYDKLYEADFLAKYWSGDINLLFKYHAPQTGFRMLPLVGFRYNFYEENLNQHGTFDNSSGVSPTLGILTTPSRNTILSATQNQLYLGQIGFQAELADEHFTVGVAPKFGVGTNVVKTHVLTSDLRDSAIAELADDGVTSSRQRDVIFGSNIDLNAYLKVRVNPWLSLTGSAYYWYMPSVARAANTIVYDDLGIDVAPAFRGQKKTNAMGIHGYTVGAEISF